MRFLLLLSLLLVGVYGAPKIYIVTRNENCEGTQPITINMIPVNGSDIVPDKVIFSGEMDVKEKIPGPIEISFEANRCDFSMKKCEKYTVIKTPGICEMFQSRGGMFEDALKTFTPRIGCPIMPGKYVTQDSVLDMTPFGVFPSDGFVWIVTIKVVAGKNKKLAMCMTVETKIMKSKKRKGKN